MKLRKAQADTLKMMAEGRPGTAYTYETIKRAGGSATAMRVLVRLGLAVHDNRFECRNRWMITDQGREAVKQLEHVA